MYIQKKKVCPVLRQTMSNGNVKTVSAFFITCVPIRYLTLVFGFCESGCSPSSTFNYVNAEELKYFSYQKIELHR